MNSNYTTTWQGARQRKATRLQRAGAVTIIICVAFALVCLAILLTGCGTAETINLCDPLVSFVQVSDTAFDAYKGGVVIARSVTFDMIAAACAK